MLEVGGWRFRADLKFTIAIMTARFIEPPTSNFEPPTNRLQQKKPLRLSQNGS